MRLNILLWVHKFMLEPSTKIMKFGLKFRIRVPELPKKIKKKIFEPYKRLDHKTTGGESSTGLGLSIVKRVMDQHHARIEVDSEMGVGSTFRLIFQLDEVSA